MKIVESILSQLQSGAGTEGINTRPQDEITIPPPGVNLKEVMGTDIKSFRKYIVEVGVTDVTAAIKRREGETDKDHNQRLKKLVELANVSELQYQVFYSTSQDVANAPMFQPDEYFRKNNIDFMKFAPGQRIAGPNGEDWEFLGVRQLNLDKDATYNTLNPSMLKSTSDITPVYPHSKDIKIGPAYAPPGLQDDSVFFYSDLESRKTTGLKGEGLQKRSFVVNFQPPNRPGWYKLRFASRTNRILGVRADQKASELNDESTVNIGTVQLTVRDLKKVQKELQSALDKYNLPSTDNFIKNPNIDAFDRDMQKAISLAMSDPNSVEVIGKIRLYSYIAKLLAPGMSANFDQNRGSIEFNIRVITPKPTLADPVVSMQTSMSTFDALQPVFDFSISPFQGGQNTLEGRVLDAKGSVVSRISFKALDEIPGSGVAKAVNGKQREYRAIVDSKLAPGTYKIEVNHGLMSKKGLGVSDLYVFKTALTKESIDKLNQKLNLMAFYGYPLTFDLIPESGNKIAANQFRTYLSFDNGSQKPPVEGLAITQEMGLRYTPDASKVTARVTWIQPFTGTEIDLYPAKTFNINQEEPTIGTRSVQVNISGTATKPKFTINGIKIISLSSGSDKPCKLSVKVGEVKKESGFQTYQVASEPSITQEGDSWTVTFDMGGTLPKGETKLKGQLTIMVNATAINPVNGKSSKAASSQISIPVNWEPDRGGRRGR